MKENMGSLDRIIRVIVAVVLVALYFTHIITGIWAIAVAVIFVGTSMFSFCPLYFPFGISTKKQKE